MKDKKELAMELLDGFPGREATDEECVKIMDYYADLNIEVN